MGGENLSKDAVRWLTYLVYILLTILTIIVGSMFKTVYIDMPKEYVAKEQYRCDIDDIRRDLQKDIQRQTEKLDAISQGIDCIKNTLASNVNERHSIDKRVQRLEDKSVEK